MKSTSVPSNSRENQEMNNPSLFSGQTIPNKEGNIEMPPRAASTGISKKAIKIADAIGEILEIPVGDCKVNENNTMELENGKIKNMKRENAYQTIVEDKQKRQEMKEEAEKKNGRVQAGMEMR